MENLFNLGQPDYGPLEKKSTLEEGEVYICRKGQWERLPKTDDSRRRIRITEDVYQAAMKLGQRLRKDLKGYKPDVSLVASALILEGCREIHLMKAKEVLGDFVIKLFKPTS